MKFCTQCNKTLSILDNDSTLLCQDCARKNTRQAPHSGELAQTQTRDIFKSKLLVKNGKIVLESEEGWLLWSGESASHHELATIISRGEKILAIRKRQKK